MDASNHPHQFHPLHTFHTLSPNLTSIHPSIHTTHLKSAPIHTRTARKTAPNAAHYTHTI
jgi:hypothetical protein